MKLGARGAALIKSREELRLVAYQPKPTDKWTVGWGHTGSDVHPGLVITKERAEELFQQDTADAVAVVNALHIQLSQSMFDALVCLVFNAGAVVVRADMTIGRALRVGKWFEAWAGFALWRKDEGQDSLGLARRRTAEMGLFLEEPLPAQPRPGGAGP